MQDNVIRVPAMEAERILDPPNYLFFLNAKSVRLYVMPDKESFCVSVVSPWTTYYCHSFYEVNRCIEQIHKQYYGGNKNGDCRLTQEG